ncbi:MAG TPA: hypothetical protein P5081_05040 [Phycisphaerae bacterium]|nr:hypothetical protein [Phycisphaerae bacterium]HRW52230.1 hypothetical protein [Phycisphaerae bacterium]
MPSNAAFYLRVARQLSLKSNRHLGPLLDADLRRWRDLRRQALPFEADSDEQHLSRAFAWLRDANQALRGRGFPTKYSLGPLFGLGPPYPETTGYTICTLLTILRQKERFAFLPLDDVRSLAEKATRYLLSTQLEGGAFSGGHALMKNFGRPSVFNTGQILLGLADALETVSDAGSELPLADRDRASLERSVRRAADFMCGQITTEGGFDPQFTYLKSSKAYYTRAAYGLLRAGQALQEQRYVDATRRHFDWVVSLQRPDGWIDHWGFDETFAVLHTIAYTLRGLIEAGVALNDERYTTTVMRSLDFLATLSWASPTLDQADSNRPAIPPAYVAADRRVVPELCITGLSQLAIVLKKVSLATDLNRDRRDVWFSDIVNLTRRFQPRDFRNRLMNGVMPASWPLDGRYQPNDFIEWGTKFFMDSLLLSMGAPAESIRG